MIQVPLTDIAVNLSNGPLQHKVAEILAQAKDVNVQRIIALGCSIDGSRKALNVAQQFPEQVFCSAGIHPHDAKTFDEHSLLELSELAKHNQVVALGECGLDFNRDFSPRDQQATAFEAQLALAAKLNMPVIMHQRDAHELFIDILKRYRPSLPNAVLHCFTGTKSELDDYLALDLHIGVTGWVCDERRGQDLREAVKHIPANRLMIETDSPYLLPRDLKPKPKSRNNSPKHLPHIAQAIATLRNEPLEQLLDSCLNTTNNFFNFST